MTAPALRSPTVPRVIGAAADLAPAERVAVVLSLMEPERARALAAEWTPAEVDRVVAAYEGMGTLPRPVVLEVVAGFVTDLASPHPRVRGGHRQASALAEAIMPSPAEDEAPAGADAGDIGEGAPPEAVWVHAAGLAPGALARLVAGERPAVIAAVVTRLGEARGAALLAALDEDAAVPAALHLAGAPQLAPATMDAIAEALRGQAAGGGAKPEAEDGAGTLTALLNRCPQARQEAVLTPLRARDEDLAARVEAGLIRFDTLTDRLPRTAAPALFREADQDVLDTALRHGAAHQPGAVDFLYSNISQRLAEQIRERVAERPMPDDAAGEAAQAQLIGTLMTWAEEGRFAFKAAGEA